MNESLKAILKICLSAVTAIINLMVSVMGSKLDADNISKSDKT